MPPKPLAGFCRSSDFHVGPSLPCGLVEKDEPLVAWTAVQVVMWRVDVP